MICSMLFSHAILHRKDDYLPTFLLIFWVLGKTQHFSCFVGNSQSLYGYGIGKGIIVNILCPFISSHNIVDMVHPVITLLHSADPKISNLSNDLIPLPPQPLLVLGHAVVIPSCKGHTATNMVLQRSSQCPNRSLLISNRWRFPREHGSFVPINKCIIFSLF